MGTPHDARRARWGAHPHDPRCYCGQVTLHQLLSWQLGGEWHAREGCSDHGQILDRDP